VLVIYKVKPRFFKMLSPFIGCQDVGAGYEDDFRSRRKRARLGEAKGSAPAEQLVLRHALIWDLEM